MQKRNAVQDVHEALSRDYAITEIYNHLVERGLAGMSDYPALYSVLPLRPRYNSLAAWQVLAHAKPCLPTELLARRFLGVARLQQYSHRYSKMSLSLIANAEYRLRACEHP